MIDSFSSERLKNRKVIEFPTSFQSIAYFYSLISIYSFEIENITPFYSMKLREGVSAGSPVFPPILKDTKSLSNGNVCKSF